MSFNCSIEISNKSCNGCQVNVTRKSVSCPLSFTEFVGYFYIHTIICTVGFILNCINCAIFCRKKQFEGAAYRFMTVLSVFDALTLLLNLPRGIIRCGSFMNCRSPNYRLFQLFIANFENYAGLFLHNMTEAISAWLTCFLSIERYLAIKYHYIVKAYFSPPNVHKMLAIIVAVGIIFHMPMFFVQKMIKRYSCRKKKFIHQIRWSAFGASNIYQSYSWVRATLVMFAPLLFLCIVNTLLIHLVRRQSRLHSVKEKKKANSSSVTAASASRTDKRNRAQRKLTILLVVIICLFLGGQIPLAFSYEKILSQLKPCKKECCYGPRIYTMIAENCSAISYAANFFVYVALNRHFRKALGDMCCVMCKFCRRVPESSSERPNGTYQAVPMTTMAINEDNSPVMTTSIDDDNVNQRLFKNEEPSVIMETKDIVHSDSASPLDGELHDVQDSEMCPNMGEDGDDVPQQMDITAV